MIKAFPISYSLLVKGLIQFPFNTPPSSSIHRRHHAFYKHYHLYSPRPVIKSRHNSRNNKATSIHTNQGCHFMPSPAESPTAATNYLKFGEVFQTTLSVLDSHLNSLNSAHHIKQKVMREERHGELKCEWALSSVKCKKRQANWAKFSRLVRKLRKREVFG